MVEKQTISQRDFSMGVILPRFIDGDDLDMRAQSLKDALNLRVSSARTLLERPATAFNATAVSTWQFHEMRVQLNGVDQTFAVVLKPNSL